MLYLIWGQIVLGHTVGKIRLWSFERGFSVSLTVSDSPPSRIEAHTEFLYILSEDGMLKIFQLLDITDAAPLRRCKWWKSSFDFLVEKPKIGLDRLHRTNRIVYLLFEWNSSTRYSMKSQ
jgi:hypothetical protein